MSGSSQPKNFFDAGCVFADFVCHFKTFRMKLLAGENRKDPGKGKIYPCPASRKLLDIISS